MEFSNAFIVLLISATTLSGMSTFSYRSMPRIMAGPLEISDPDLYFWMKKLVLFGFLIFSVTLLSSIMAIFLKIPRFLIYIFSGAAIFHAILSVINFNITINFDIEREMLLDLGLGDPLEKSIMGSISAIGLGVVSFVLFAQSGGRSR